MPLVCWLCAFSLELPHSQLHPGPAVMYVLAAPQPAAAAAAPPATKPGGSPLPEAATLWACLPLLFVGNAAAHQQLMALFEAMAAELLLQQPGSAADLPGQQQQQQGLSHAVSSASVARPVTPGHSEASDVITAPDDNSAAASTLADVTATSSSSSSSDLQQVYRQLHLQHWQPMLWDWLYAVQATDTSCIGSIPAMAATLQNRPATAGPVAAAAGCTGSSSSSSNVQLQEAKQLLASELLLLLAGRGLRQAAQELLSHLSSAQGAAAAAGPGTAAAAAADAPHQPRSIANNTVRSRSAPVSPNRPHRGGLSEPSGSTHPGVINIVSDDLALENDQGQEGVQ
jgi:hypothetical protein